MLIKDGIQNLKVPEEALDMLDKVKSFLHDYLFLLIIVAVIMATVLIVMFARKHMPNKGRITDLFDKNGNKKDPRHTTKEDEDQAPNFRY